MKVRSQPKSEDLAVLLRDMRTPLAVASAEVIEQYRLDSARDEQVIASLKARIEELEAALRFYADMRRYDGPNQKPIPGDQYADQDAVYIKDVTRDRGQIARDALEAKHD